MKSDLELKADILKNMADVFRGEEAASWKDVMEEGLSPEPESEDEECECGKPDCLKCGKVELKDKK